ncbi:MAG: mannose-6-phosphate isomerase, class I [Pontimonas sp.]
MAFPLHAQLKHYDWGVRGALSHALGREPSGSPEAEIWWGNHPLAECAISTPSGFEDLPTWLEKTETDFPLLVKLLAAERPLSIQVHPSKTQAESGFGHEEAAGIPLDAPERTYKDRSAKPELIIALSEEFVGLASFATRAAVRERLARWLGAGAPQSLAELVESVADDPRETARRIVENVSSNSGIVLELEQWLASVTSSHFEPTTAAEVQLLQQVSSAHPGDAGILFVLLMHHVHLKRGEALFVADGEVHAYIKGFGLEVMLPSDNVVRVGLTSKHKDGESFMELSNFSPTKAPLIVSPRRDSFRDTYQGFGADFSVHRISSGAQGFSLASPSVCFVESGVAVVRNSEETMLHRGDVVLALPGETLVPQSEDAVVWVVHAGSD